MERHVDRWNELLIRVRDDREEEDEDGEWSEPRNLAPWADYLMFDLFGDICFGKTNGTKEPGPNPLKEIPGNIASYMRFYYPVCSS
jgi:hypothetical protein